jgi:hypothetical protein
MGRIHNKQFEDHVIGGQFAGGNLYLLKANGVTAVVSPGQQRPVNDKRFNQVSVAQNSDYIVSGAFQGSDLVLTKNSGDTIVISGGVPNTTLPSLLGNTVHSEQNCESIIGGSIDGGTITLFKLCGDDIVITGYTNTYPDTVGFDVVTTTTTIPPTTTTTTLRAFDPITTTTTTVAPTTTTTTTLGEGQFIETSVALRLKDSINGDVVPMDYTDAQLLKDDILAWSNSDGNNGSSQSTYYIDTATISVGSKIYRFTDWVDVNVDGLRFHNDFGDEGYKIVEWLDGVAQQVWTIGNLNGIITDGSDGFDVVVQNITTTTTFSGQSFNRISERSVVRLNGVEAFRPSDYRNDRQGFYCALVDSIIVGDPLVNDWSASGSTKKYYGEFQVGTQIYSFSGNMDIYKNGFYLMSISGSSVYGGGDHLMVEFADGVVQSIVNVGTNVYTFSDGNVQGEIYTDNDLYGTCS